MNTPHPYRLLASAIIERPIYIAYLAGDNAKAHTDGERIYLPEIATLDQQRSQVLAHSALIAADSLSRDILTSLVGRPDLQKRYFALELERICHQLSDLLPDAFLSSLMPYLSGHRSAEPAESLLLAKGRKKVSLMPEWLGCIYPLKLLRHRADSQIKSLSQGELSELESQLKKLEKDLAENEEDENKTKDLFWQLFSSPLGKNGMLARLLQELLDMSSAPERGGSDTGAGTSIESVSGRMVKRLKDAANALRAGKDAATPSAFVLAESGAHSYPEWDYANARYKQNWVNVEEVEPWTEEPLLEAVNFSGSNSRYQRSMAGLCFNYERHKKQPQGDDLVLDSLVDMVVTTRSGHNGDPKIYSANLRTRRDLAVQILLDVSSSTQESTDSGHQICSLQAEAAWQLCRAFSGLGDRVALHGFHSWGRKLVRFQRIKSFDDLMGTSVERRIRNLSIAGYTRYGAAIRHAATQLERFSGMPRQLLLIISDGYPYDDQYEGKYAEEDTRKALEEVRGASIATVCLSVGSDVDHKKLKKIYGDTNYLTVDKLDKIANQLRPVVEAALSQALVSG